MRELLKSATALHHMLQLRIIFKVRNQQVRNLTHWVEARDRVVLQNRPQSSTLQSLYQGQVILTSQNLHEYSVSGYT